MNVSEGMVASGLGIMGAAGALCIPIAQMDPVSTGARLAQLGAPGIMAAALVVVTAFTARILRDRDRSLADRFSELKAEREEYAQLVHEATGAIERNSKTMELVARQSAETAARTEAALGALTTKLSAIEIVGAAMVDAVRHCQRNGARPS
jgi:hypothetical protein